MVSLPNHEVGYADLATTSSFDRLRMRSTAAFAQIWSALDHGHFTAGGIELRID
jgi:hypothetical protein